MIPFNRPAIAGDEIARLAEAAASGRLSGDGPFTLRCQQRLEALLGAKRVSLTTSCTHALETAAFLLDLGPDDEVILPSFTFVSTATAFLIRGARPVFADIRPDTLNIDAEHVAAAISERTRAVVVVHYAGVGCEMDRIVALCRARGLVLIEDNAHGLFGKQKGRALGTFGQLAALSFHETKNITCGEGGALILNDDSYVERAEIIREKGTNRSQFFRGAIDKYEWVDRGSSYLPSDLLAAFLSAQLDQRDEIQRQRKRVWERYQAHLSPWAPGAGVRLPFVPDDCEQPYHMFYLLMPGRAERDGLIESLRRQDIQAVFHYLPLHTSPMGRQLGYAAGDFPVTEDASARLVRLPFFKDLADEDIDRVCEAVMGYVG